jgi:hypothetical protein
MLEDNHVLAEVLEGHVVIYVLVAVARRVRLDERGLCVRHVMLDVFIVLLYC